MNFNTLSLRGIRWRFLAGLAMLIFGVFLWQMCWINSEYEKEESCINPDGGWPQFAGEYFIGGLLYRTSYVFDAAVIICILFPLTIKSARFLYAVIFMSGISALRWHIVSAPGNLIYYILSAALQILIMMLIINWMHSLPGSFWKKICAQKGKIILCFLILLIIEWCWQVIGTSLECCPIAESCMGKGPM